MVGVRVHVPRLTFPKPQLFNCKTVNQLGYPPQKWCCLPVVETHDVSLVDGGPDESSEEDSSSGERELHRGAEESRSSRAKSMSFGAL